MSELSFCLPITPTAQQRPRHARFGAHDVTYKSATRKANERTLEACLLPHRPKTPLSGPLELSFRATFSASEPAEKAMRGGIAGQNMAYVKAGHRQPRQAAQGRHDPSGLLG